MGSTLTLHWSHSLRPDYLPPCWIKTPAAICGLNLAPEENRMVRCGCGFTVDRDVNAAKNILAKGLRFGPVALPVEAMVQEPASAAILKVDGSEKS